MRRPALGSKSEAIELRPSDFLGRSVDLYLNSTCNLKCKTCFLGDDYFTSALDMKLEVARDILRWAKAAQVEDVAFLGGEPSLYPYIAIVLEFSRSIGIPANRFITNGSRPFIKMMSTSVADYVDWVYVSLDGPDEGTNDAVRGRGSFAQAIRSMQILRNRHIPFTITTSLTPSSMERLEDLLGLAEESGCKTLNIHWVSPTGRARDGTCSVLPSKWLELCDQVAAYRPARPDLDLQCQLAYAGPGTASRMGLDTTACAVRDRTNLQFMPNGSVYACGLLVDRPGMSAYRWVNQSLRVSMGPSELTLCKSSEPGCPARREVLGEVFAETASEYLPLCIYQRFHNAAG